MRTSSSSPKVTDLERRDVADLYRVHDFSKANRADELIASAHTRGLTINAFFDELYAQYRITHLPDRAAVLEHMATAVPDSTPEERLAAVRRAEIRALNGADATLDLKREVKRRVAGEAAAGVPQPENPLQEAIRKLRHVDPTSTEAVATAAAQERSRTSGTASIDVSHRRDVKDIIGSLEQTSPPTETPQSKKPNEAALTADQPVVREASAAEVPPRPQPPTHPTPTAATAPSTANAVELDRGPIDNASRAAKLSSAPSKAVMDGIIEADVREWLVKVLGDAFNANVKSSAHLVDSLRDGVVLNVLLQKLQDPPTPDDDVRVPKRTVGFFARDNVAQFLIQARKQFNLVDAQLFTDSDLCDGKDDRQVITCLMAIARLAYQRGVTKEAPSLIVYEKEIEQSEAAHMTSEQLTRIVEEACAAEEQFEEQEEAEGEPEDETDEGVGRAPSVSDEQLSDAGATQHREGEDRADAAEPLSSTEVDAPAEKAVPAAAPPEALSNDGSERHACASEVDAAQQSHTAAPEFNTCAPSSQDPCVLDAPAAAKPRDGEQSPSPSSRRDEAESESVTAAEEDDTEASPTKPCKAPRKGPLVVRKAEPAQKPVRYFAHHWDYVDVGLGNVLNAHYAAHPTSPWRFRAFAANAGEYVLYSVNDIRTKRLLFVRIIQQSLVVRQSQAPGGPGWMPLKEFLDQLEQEALSS